MTAAILAASLCAAAALVIVWALLAAAKRSSIVADAICPVCETEVEWSEPWRWAEHLRRPVHSTCIPSLIRSLGEAYVDLWLETGDAGMRLKT